MSCARNAHRLVLSAALLGLALPAAAIDPGYYVVTPYPNEGVRIVDLRYWTTKTPQGPEVVWPEFGLGYGVNSRWTTEVFVSWVGTHSQAVRPSTLNWQNDFMLTQGEWPVDVALHLQLVKSRRDPQAFTVQAGPVLQTDIGRTQLNFNAFVDQTRGSAQAPVSRLSYQWQLRHRLWPGLHLGAQGFGELGPWQAWLPAARQSHRAGPAVFGTARFSDQTRFKLQAAWLEGKTFGQRGHMFTLRAHTEF